MQCIRLNEYALKIQLSKELPQHSPFVVLPGGPVSIRLKGALNQIVVE